MDSPIPGPGTAVIATAVTASPTPEEVELLRALEQADSGRQPLITRRWWRITLGVALPLTLLVLWQLSTTLVWLPVSQLPSPTMVFDAGIDLLNRGLLVKFVAISTQRVVTGFLVGASLGLLLGAITGLSRSWEQFFGPTLSGVRAVPSLAWVPLLLIYLKIGEESKVTLIAIGAFFPVYTITSAALRHVDRQLVEAGRAFGLRGVHLFTTIQLPAVLPSVISGLRLALAQSWLFLVAAELLAANAGLGFLLTDSSYTGRIDRMFLAILALGIIGLLSDSLLRVFERWAIRRWT